MTLIMNRRRLLASVSASLVLSALPGRADSAPLIGFTHGVASGDPGRTAVTLWTRFVGSEPTPLRAEIADDPAFQRIVLTGMADASPASDFCARARVEGLEPGRWHHYRFVAPNGETSAVGRTRTLPGSGIDRFRIAVFSCSNGTSGWFNAYAHAAAREDIDLALHLGDYIYESPVTRADATPGLAQQRGLAPPGEILALADYRQRYASYRADPDLAELHRRLPMIAVWDDHETANNSWSDGASGHDPAAEGQWFARKAAGVRTWHEWLPIQQRWYDSYQIGDLATLFRIETRLLGRSRQLDDDIESILAAGGSDLPARLSAFRTGPLADPKRSMMGPDQERWLADGLKASVASATRWQVLAQQVIMGSYRSPKAGSHWAAGPMPSDLKAELDQRALLAGANLPSNFDKWDGYPAARQRLYDSTRAAGANLVTLTGDSHNAWAFNLGDRTGPVGVEFAGQSVSSHGFERRFNGDPSRIAADFVAANPDLKWMDSSQRGYFILDITRDRIEAEYVFVPATAGRSAAATGRHTIAVEHGARRLSLG